MAKRRANSKLIGILAMIIALLGLTALALLVTLGPRSFLALLTGDRIGPEIIAVAPPKVPKNPRPPPMPTVADISSIAVYPISVPANGDADRVLMDQLEGEVFQSPRVLPTDWVIEDRQRRLRLPVAEINDPGLQVADADIASQQYAPDISTLPLADRIAAYLASKEPLADFSGALLPKPSMALRDPAAVIRSNGSPVDSVAEQVTEWEEAVARNEASPLMAFSARLTSALQQSTLSCPSLYKIGSSMAFVSGDQSAAPFFSAAVRTAEQSQNIRSSPDAASLAADKTTLEAMAFKALWRLNDYDLATRCYKLLINMEPPKSSEQWEAATLYSLLLVRQQPDQEDVATQTLEKVIESGPDRVPPAIQLKARSSLAQLLFEQQRDVEVVNQLKPIIGSSAKSGERSPVYLICIESCVRLGDVQTAGSVYASWQAANDPEMAIFRQDIHKQMQDVTPTSQPSH